LHGAAPIAFSVVRSGAHEDWRHVGVPDALPDAASGDSVDAWSHWRVSPAELARVPSRWSAPLPGNASVSLPFTAEGVGSIDPELLLLYPSNDFALEAGVVGGQIQRLRPTPRTLLLPLLLGEHALGDD
jgi:hypothetical protein